MHEGLVLLLSQNSVKCVCKLVQSGPAATAVEIVSCFWGARFNGDGEEILSKRMPAVPDISPSL